MKILLISGHGNGDVGAIGNGYQEYKLTRELVNLIKPRLEKYADVDVYDQSRNAFKDVQNGQFKVGKYDYVLEVHFNAYKDSSAKGTEIFVTTREKGISVEQGIMKVMGKYFTLRDNDSVFDGVKRTNFLVINTLKNKGMSGALLEVCFITNKNEMKIYQVCKESIAFDIAEAIAEGFKLKPKTSSSNTKKENNKTVVKSEKKSVTEVAKEVVNGKWGNGQKRVESLKKAGYDPTEVQKKVNELLGAKTNVKSITQVAQEVINGKWGNGSDRKKKLEQAGYNYEEVQKKVNELLK